MKKLDVLFSEKVSLQISDVNEKLEIDLPKSTIARAAMQIGLNELLSYSDDIERHGGDLISHISIQNLKALN